MLENALKDKLDTKDSRIIKLRAEGYTIRAIALELGLSAGTVSRRIRKLKDKGLLR